MIRPNIRDAVRDAVSKALGRTDRDPRALDDLGTRFARRLGIPVLTRPVRRVPRPVLNRADRRRGTHPGRTRMSGYRPATSPRTARPNPQEN